MVAVESCLYDSVLKRGEPGRICVSGHDAPEQSRLGLPFLFLLGCGRWTLVRITEAGVSGHPARLWCNINSALIEVRRRQVRDGNRYWVLAFGKSPLFHTGRIR